MTTRRRFLALSGLAVGALAVPAHADTNPNPNPNPRVSSVQPLGVATDLRAAAMTNPLGIDLATPTLSWRLGTGNQTAYQIQVATDKNRLRAGHPDLWDSGQVPGNRTWSLTYAGAPVPARTRAFWRVRVWTDEHTAARSEPAWSQPAWWETGLLEPADWTARWVGNADWEQPRPLITSVGAQQARYLRMTVTDLGRPDSPLLDPVRWQPRLQLAEITLIDSAAPTVDVALGATVTTTDSTEVAGQWSTAYLTDGKLTSATAPYGYQSTVHSDTDVSSTPIVLNLDLGQVRGFDQVLVYPRWDAPGQWGITPDYPRSYTLAVANDPAGPFTVVGKVSKDDKPYPPSSLHTAPAGLPLFATQFSVRGGVDHARLYVSAAGIQISSVNGLPVTDAVLEPPNTDVKSEVQYATYDVTNLLRVGENALGVEVGNGIWNIFDTPDAPTRYIKATASNGPPRMIAQLEITYRNGHRQIVGSDNTWRTTLGPTTFSNWYGGEDFDARRTLPDWNTPAADLRTWSAAVQTSAPSPLLAGRLAPPIQQVDVHPARAITSPSAGVYVLDFGINSAGRQELQFHVPAGTTIQMYPGEKLTTAGAVDQSTTGSPIYDTYTAAGVPGETWSPRFIYHGFRYLELRGLPSAPALSDARTLVLRTANRSAGSFSCSHDLLNSIHRIIDRAVQSNMYSVFTDCPHREKLGWLDDTGLIFGVAARGYDVEAYYRKIIRDIAEAQTDAGMIPTTAPEITLFAGGYRDEVNWGTTLIAAPLALYRYYGDDTTLRTYYPAMRSYLGYLGTQASGNLLNSGLGDWETLDASTPVGVTASYGYKRAADLIAQVADILGKSGDAAGYRALAAQIAGAFNTSYYDAATASYSSGSQACNALALDGGFVANTAYPAVLATLIANIRAAGNHLQVGEIGLPAVFRVLAENNRHDVIYDIATQTDFPSYGHQVLSGSTSLAEVWGGMGTSASQNHWMLGAIDEWFTAGIGGITQAPESAAFQDIRIAPAAVGDLTSASAAYLTPHGTVSTNWRRDPTGFGLTVVIPPNTTATVTLPTIGTTVSAPPGATRIAARSYQVGTGSWQFATR